MVHNKKTHTNINVKEKSNHPTCVKKGITKGFADRARALCDDVFVANGFERKKVQEYMKESKEVENKYQLEEQGCRGMVVVDVRGLSEQFR